MLSGLSLPLQATSLQVHDIPQPLQPWIHWVLHDVPTHICPWRYNQKVNPEKYAENDLKTVCYWPSHFTLTVENQQAQFRQEWQVYSPGWLALPGDEKYWPQQVTMNEKNAPVADRHGIPHIFAPTGSLTIQGHFFWETMPEHLLLPVNTGLVTLVIDNNTINFPHLDEQGRLWLRQRGHAVDEQAEQNRLDMRIYRHIVDEIPLQLITRIELEVAGRHREVELGPVLLDQHRAMALHSPLPARLETDGRLRVQVRPGSWEITLRTRQLGLVNQLTLPSDYSAEQWVEEEIWVFEARHELRLVEIQGVTAIDPQQTDLPAAWRQFPTYQVQAGDTLQLVEKRRGDPEPAPDQLHLERNFWLDFDGHGYSIQDEITGTMTRGWRLEMAEPTVLGRVTVNGQAQFITRLEEQKEQKEQGELSKTGVEVRRGMIQLTADSRLENGLNHLPAVGWDHDFQQVSAYLHLPPGWQLFHASGVDDVPDTWLKRWTLLDLFLVLIMAAAVGKLWRWWWGGLALITMILIYHEIAAPHWVWLNILVSIALLRVLPKQGWLPRLVRLYRDVSLIALLIIVLPFMMQQVRQSIYPQLEKPWQQLDTSGYDSGESYYLDESVESDDFMAAGSLSAQPIKQEVSWSPMEKTEVQSIAIRSPKIVGKPFQDFNANLKSQPLLQIDPHAQVQTGRGLPKWEWETISMRYSGPVDRNQSIQLWLLSPQMNSLLGFLRVILLAVLTVFLLWQAWYSNAKTWLNSNHSASPSFSGSSASTTMSVILLFLLFFIASLSAGLPLKAATLDAINDNQQKTANIQSVDNNPLTSSDSSLPAHFPSPILLEELQQRLLEPQACLPTCASSPRLRLELIENKLIGRMEIHSLTTTVVPLPGIAKQWLPQQVLLNGETASGLSRDNEGYLWLYVTAGIHQVQFSGLLPVRNIIQLPLPLKPRRVEITTTDWQVEGVHENGLADDQLQFTRTEESFKAELEMGHLEPFVQIERILLVGLDWQMITRVTRLTPLGAPIVLKIPLLLNESVTSEQIRVENQHVLINLSPEQTEISWQSVIDKQEVITLTAPETLFSSEIWRLDASAIWHVELTGIPVVHHQDEAGRWLPEWRPWPGEQVILKISRPAGMSGQVVTLDHSQLIVSPGQRTTDNQLLLNFRSSRGGQHQITLPENAQLQLVKINDKSQPIRQEGRTITIPLTPGTQQVSLSFRQPIGMSDFFQTPVVDLGLESVNTHIEINMPSDRWILFVDGEPIGPAVMIWGILIVIMLGAIGLGQISLTPLKTHHWLLLGIVLSQISVPLMLAVVGWFMALGWRARLAPETSAIQFDLTQIILVVLTIVALGAVLLAIKQGLLGHPDMHIMGNGSDFNYLRWYQDRTNGHLPQVWVFSWSMWVYRIAMLLWALWLSFALLRWLRWGWDCFSTHGLWWSLKKKLN
jgi:hypothetical protein